MQPIITIYFSDPGAMDYPFNKPEYFEVYQNLINQLEGRDVQVFIVRANSYLGNGLFKKGWFFQNNKLSEYNKQIKSDLIFNRDDKNTIPRIIDCKIINHPDFDDLCLDKVKTAKFFPEMSPRTVAINSWPEFQQTVSAWNLVNTEIIVLKKNFETEGRGIFIKTIKEITENIYQKWDNILVQEFLDSSVGIPGLVKGLHDLRVTVVNGRPINSFMRQPKPGSYLANVSQGGSGRSISLNQVPSEILDKVKEINSKISQYYPSLYGADFVNSSEGYKLIELNSRPGMQHPSWSGTYQKFNNAVLEMLVEAV